MHRPELWWHSDGILNDVEVILLISVHGVLDSHVTDVINNNIIISFDIVKLLNVILITNECLSHVVDVSVGEGIDEIQNWITRLAWLDSEMCVNLKLGVGVCFINSFQDVGSSLMNFILEELAFGSLLDEGQE